MREKRDFIREVVERADIVDVIGRYITLKKRGKSYVALCPFHSEKKPSFTVSPDRGLYYCFGCNKGGNAITFLKEYRKVDTKEAVVELAEMVGIEVPEWFMGEDFKSRKKEYDKLLAINEEALKYYRKMLNSPEGHSAREYLRMRGMTEEAIVLWGMGYATSLSNGLVNHLISKGFDESDILKAGLAVKRDGELFDLFRNRIIFPIFDERKRIVGFAGRTLGDEEPKYLNIPETPIYKKSYVLYGMDKAWNEIKRKGYAVLVEGYMDVISLHMNGVSTAVATCGTALGETQLRILKRITEKVVLMFDGDEGGRRAMMRAIEPFLRSDLIPYGVFLPDGSDPDEFVREKGSEEVVRLIENAVDIFETFIKEKSYGVDSIRTKRLRIEEIVDLLKLLESEVEREHYIRIIASSFSIPTFMVNEIERRKGTLERKTVPIPESKGSPEVTLLRLLLRSPEVYIERAKEYKDYFSEPFRIFFENWTQSMKLEDGLMALEEAGIDPSPFVSVIVDERDFMGNEEEIFRVLIRRIREKKILEEIERLQKEIESLKSEVPVDILKKKEELVLLIKKIKEEK